MEIKQLEFFIACTECGSLGRAAEKLYTSQPNVSRVIRSLEEELGKDLFERTTKGLVLTEYGQAIQSYAYNILKNQWLITKAKDEIPEPKIRISAYASNALAQTTAIFLSRHRKLLMEYRHGTMEETLEQVEKRISDIGIVCIPKNKMQAFRLFAANNGIEYKEYGEYTPNLYLGASNPLYNRSTVRAEELADLRFARGLGDFFALHEDAEDPLRSFRNANDRHHYTLITNSEHLINNVHSYTDIVALNLPIEPPKKRNTSIKSIPVEGESAKLTFVIIYRADHTLKDYEKEYIRDIEKLIATLKKEQNKEEA